MLESLITTAGTYIYMEFWLHNPFSLSASNYVSKWSPEWALTCCQGRIFQICTYLCFVCICIDIVYLYLRLYFYFFVHVFCFGQQVSARNLLNLSTAECNILTGRNSSHRMRKSFKTLKSKEQKSAKKDPATTRKKS